MEVVTTVTTNKKTKNKASFLFNESEKGNPIVTALVQTPKTIDYKDVGGGKYRYTREGIEHAIKGLVGYQVEDEQHKGTGDKSFATITNGGYCPEWNGGYVEMEVFKPEYHELMRNIAENMEKGINPKKGFSTEVQVKNAEPEGNDEYTITNMEYDGLIWTKQPRDEDTGICSVKLNKKSVKPFIRRDKMTDEKLLKLQADYTELEGKYKKLEEDYTKSGKAYEKLADEYKTGKELYGDLEGEVKDLKGQLEPIWEATEKERVEVLDKVVENAKEDERETLRKSLENKSKEELTILLNAMQPTAKGVVHKPPTPTIDDDDDGLTTKDVLEITGMTHLIKE